MGKTVPLADEKSASMGWIFDPVIGYAVTKMPSPSAIKEARHRAGLTQAQAAALKKARGES